MKKFKYIFISSIILFIVMILVHFVYDIFKLNIIAIIFPVNESIFQHMKMIYLSFFLFYLVLYFIRKRFLFNNIFLTNLISVIICIIFFLLVYLPVYFTVGENMIFTFILLFISIMLGQLIGYKFLKKDNYYLFNLSSIFLIIIIFIMFAYFTFNPIHSDIFWDPEHETYEKVTISDFPLFNYEILYIHIYTH